MIQNTISRESAQQVYDRIGALHDWAEHYEGRAKARALDLAGFAPGQRVLDVGVGTGDVHRAIQAAVEPGGMAIGLDISSVMLQLTRRRTGAPVCLADASHLPIAPASLDRLFVAYTLDLVPYRELQGLLRDFLRLLKPCGRMSIVCLTEGVDRSSRLLVSAWKAVYAANPVACGGCRPLQLADLVEQAGFQEVHREVVVQLGVPSEVISAVRAASEAGRERPVEGSLPGRW